MSHLGDRASAFVDGQLPPGAAERATAHLAGCRACRDLVEAERVLKAHLATLAGPAPSTGLVDRLLVLGGPSGPLPPREGRIPGTPRTPTVVLPPAPEPAFAYAFIAVRSRVARVVLPRRPAVAAVAARPSGSRRPPTRVIRPMGSGRHRARLAGALLGTLGVVGVGVAGVVVGASTADRGEPVLSNAGNRPAAANFVTGPTKRAASTTAVTDRDRRP